MHFYSIPLHTLLLPPANPLSLAAVSHKLLLILQNPIQISHFIWNFPILSFWDKVNDSFFYTPLHAWSLHLSQYLWIVILHGCVSSVNVERQGHSYSSLCLQRWGQGLAGWSPRLYDLCCCTSDPSLFPQFFWVKMTAVLNQNFLITSHYPSEMLLPSGTHWFTTLNDCNYHKW